MKNEKISELAAAERRKYQKAWRDAHKDIIKRSNKSYWERRAAKRLEAQQQEAGNVR